jgi:hypothetical protein
LLAGRGSRCSQAQRQEGRGCYGPTGPERTGGSGERRELRRRKDSSGTIQGHGGGCAGTFVIRKRWISGDDRIVGEPITMKVRNLLVIYCKFKELPAHVQIDVPNFFKKIFEDHIKSGEIRPLRPDESWIHGFERSLN